MRNYYTTTVCKYRQSLKHSIMLTEPPLFPFYRYYLTYQYHANTKSIAITFNRFAKLTGNWCTRVLFLLRKSDVLSKFITFPL